ncbi:hypothetical protein BTO06_00335 [Tenacibaculum sp. SZ-18]|uniref:hypothetical protein n=1 Tax=Tenacibaculum sp. SZ-18 TaxID=754423 RepID=UPI000C2CFACD|nr:hypothetical protein [Tenacibaculum sp. SZ-18]AUC13684.1 hypothetical protein BTO06_00335 [Tenacibaculum sp. SZ-18]
MNIQDIESIKYFLKSNPKHSIDVIDYEINKALEKKLKYADLLSKYGSLEELISLYRSKGVSRLFIQKFKPNGTSNLRVDKPRQVALENTKNLVVNETATNGAIVEPTLAPAVSTYPTSVVNQQQMLGMNGSFGMNASELISLHTKARILQELEKQNEELKETSKKLIRKNEELVDENRKLQTELMFSKERNELEILKLKLEDKPAIEPETLKALLDVGKNIVPAIIQKQSASASVTPGMNASYVNLSEIKQGLISMVSSKEFTDQQTNDLVLLAIGQQQNTEFAKELSDLVVKYNLKELI